MTYKQLIDFIENTMRMSHIYQPLLIKALVDSGGKATIRQLAQSFLLQDESQLIHYEKTIKSMPLKVLANHDVVSRENDIISLSVRKLTFEQKAQIRSLCEKRMQEFIMKKGMGLWDYRIFDSEQPSDALRNRLLIESNGRCARCGATKKDCPLDIDHIKPRSKGGKTEYTNLQVLCSKCNQSKGNKDEIDHRADIIPKIKDGCVFCDSKLKSRVIEEYESVFAITDKYPVTKGHLLIITKRHTLDYFTMTDNEHKDSNELLKILKKRMQSGDSKITGINIGINNGISAGQTIDHAHIHLIPRRDGDTSMPRGGVRGVIPTKMGY